MPRTINLYNRLIFKGFQKIRNFTAINESWLLLTLKRNHRVKEWQITVRICLFVSTVSSSLTILEKRRWTFNWRVPKQRGFEWNRNYSIYSRIWVSFWSDCLVNIMASLQTFILLSHSICSNGPSPERSSWPQNRITLSRWNEIRSSTTLFLSFSISFSISIAVSHPYLRWPVRDNCTLIDMPTKICKL